MLVRVRQAALRLMEARMGALEARTEARTEERCERLEAQVMVSRCVDHETQLARLRKVFASEAAEMRISSEATWARVAHALELSRRLDKLENVATSEADYDKPAKKSAPRLC